MMLPSITRSAVLRAQCEPLTIEELVIPPLSSGQVAIKIAFAGICHSQLNEIRGKRGEDKYLPHLLGHEASGTVVATAQDVTRVRAGDTVILSWIRGAGKDAPGPQYRRSNGDVVHAGAIAALSEYAVIAENRCTPVDRKFSLRTAALIGCAVPTGAGMVLNQVKPSPHESGIIIGVGGVGLSALMAAKLCGCSPLVAVDVYDEKLEFARSLGATHVFNSKSQKNLEVAVRDLLPQGADFIIEASGSKEVMECAFRLVKESGGRLIIAGNVAHGQTIQIDPFGLIRGKQILGSWGGQTDPSRDFAEYVRLNLAGNFPIEKLATRSFLLDEVNEAFQLLESGSVGRILVEFPN